MQSIRIYPGSDPNVVDIVGNSPPNQVWIDLSVVNTVDVNNEVFDGCGSIVVYDWFQAMRFVGPALLQQVQRLVQIAPVTWITTHQISSSPVPTLRWDFLWNRTKSAYLDKKLGWKQGPYVENFEHYPVSWNPRPKKYLQLYARPEPYRDQLNALVKNYDGYWSNANQNIFLPYSRGDAQGEHWTALPHRKFLDETYISCQVESTHRTGLAVGFTEKTYDHLIQGRLVLNFGPRDFYNTLQQDGWAVPEQIDLSWDSITDDNKRFCEYCAVLRGILELGIDDLHDLFVANKYTVQHNHDRLHSRPFDKLMIPD